MTALLVLFTILMFFTIDFFVTQRRRRVAAVREELERGSLPPIPLAEVPEGTLVSPGHVWVRPQPGGALRIGIDKVLLALLGGVEFLYAHPEGAPVRLGGPLVMLRKGARALQIRSPVDGVISSVNPATQSAPERVAQDPFQEGWIYELRPEPEAAAVPAMPSGERAARWMQDEFNRLRDFVVDLAAGSEDGNRVYADGGLPLDQVGSHIESRVRDDEWERLVSRFFEHRHEHE